MIDQCYSVYRFESASVRLNDGTVLRVNGTGSIAFIGELIHVMSDQPPIGEYSDYIYKFGDIVSIRFTRA